MVGAFKPRHNRRDRLMPLSIHLTQYLIILTAYMIRQTVQSASMV